MRGRVSKLSKPDPNHDPNPALVSPDEAGWAARGSEPAGWHHYDGAREIITERSRGMTAHGRFEMRSGIGIERRNLP